MAFSITFVLYLAVKLPTAPEHGTPGKESELVFGYLFRDGLGIRRGGILSLEDMGSNLFTYVYMSVTSFVPPALLPGQSLGLIGAPTIMAAQRGYHPQLVHLVAYHH